MKLKKETQPEEVRVQAGTSKPQTIRNMLARLQDFTITSNGVVDDEGELVHYAFYKDIEPFNVIEALKDLK